MRYYLLGITRLGWQKFLKIMYLLYFLDCIWDFDSEPSFAICSTIKFKIT